MLIEELEFEISQLSDKNLQRLHKFIEAKLEVKFKAEHEQELIAAWCYERIRQLLIPEHGAIRVEDIAPWKSLKASQQKDFTEAWFKANDYFVKRGITPGDILGEFIMKLVIRSASLEKALSPKAITCCLQMIRAEFIHQMGRIYEQDSAMLVLNQALHKNVDA